MRELKPCPFCGLALVRDRLADGTSRWAHPPRKSTADAYCPTFTYIVYSDEPKDVEAWNRRSPAPTDVGDDLEERLRPSAKADELLGYLVTLLRDRDEPTAARLLNDWIVANNAFKSDARAALTTLRERVATLEAVMGDEPTWLEDDEQLSDDLHAELRRQRAFRPLTATDPDKVVLATYPFGKIVWDAFRRARTAIGDVGDG